MAGRNQSLWLLVAAALLFAATAGAQQQQGCSSATFPAGRSFQRCAALPVLGASLHWTYHPENRTADIAFRAPSSSGGWVGWGINPTGGLNMVGSNVFIASQDGNGSASVLMTKLENTVNPSLQPTTLSFGVPVGPTVEYSGGSYTIYATISLPGNDTVQSVVWQAGPLSGGQIQMHPTAPANLQSVQKLDFMSGNSSTGAPSSRMHRRNLREFLG